MIQFAHRTGGVSNEIALYCIVKAAQAFIGLPIRFLPLLCLPIEGRGGGREGGEGRGGKRHGRAGE